MNIYKNIITLNSNNLWCHSYLPNTSFRGFRCLVNPQKFNVQSEHLTLTDYVDMIIAISHEL